VLTPDSSVVIPALDTSHESHEQAAAFIEAAGELRLIAHVALEAYHVLTRVRPYRRLPPRAVAEALRESFPGPLVGLPPGEHWALVEQAPRLGIVGGAVFDAFIATTASRAGLTLVSRDRRAASTYLAVGVDCQLLPV
jgi:predicted nucleic acid-binding protein